MKEKIIICPDEEKKNILEEYEKNPYLHYTKFINKKEFIDNYYFSYDEKTIYYLMNKYKYNIDVAKVYINNLYYIDTTKNYKNNKLNFLKNIKQELIEKKLLKFNNIFKKYIDKKELEVKNYYDFDKYIEKDLKINNYNKIVPLNKKIYKLCTIEEEVSFVCIEILKLLKKGIDINKIYLCNITDEYYYTLDKIFSYYAIPINIPYKDSIYSTKVVNDYLKDKTLDLDNPSKNIINKKLINVLESLIELDDETGVYNEILIDKLKHTYLSNKKLSNAVNIKDIKSSSFKDDEYVFVLGFNLDALPRTYKDVEFISDNDKKEVDLYLTSELNIREKCVISNILNNIKNLTLSYKLSSPFQKYYASAMIKDLNLEITIPNIEDYNCSNIYNKIRLGEMLDKYYIYGEKDNNLDILNNTYNIPYNSYKNDFTGIDNKLYIDNIKKPIKLAYTSLKSYHECKFKYYINYVLKINNYTDTFQAYIGSLYHSLLSLYKNTNFDFEKEWNKYLENKDLNLKEKVLLVKIKKDLKELISILEKQELLTGYDNVLVEKEVKIKLDKEIETEFVGYIDKIMYLENQNNIFYSIIDYKSGTIDTHIEPMKYGLNMQLPIYLYLIRNLDLFKNGIFTGIYYQNILFSYPTWSKDIEKDTKNKYMLKGYSCDDVEVLERFDTTYKDSEYIKSMKYSEEKGFSSHAKLINKEELLQMIKYTDNIINKSIDEIIKGDFKINPKVYDKENISCKFCTFKDLCYTEPKDITYLDKVTDLGFLGGEE